MFSQDAVAAHGEPSRLSSDRSEPDGNPIDVALLYASGAPGSIRRAGDRARSWIQRRTMQEFASSFARYTIERPDRPPLVGVVGVVDLARYELLPHEGVMASSVTARRADLERAGAMLEPIVVAVDEHVVAALDEPFHERSAVLGDELHRVELFPAGARAAGGPTSGVILDGHHRVEALRAFADATGASGGILTMVVEAANGGLFVEPQHRLLEGTSEAIDQLLALGTEADDLPDTPTNEGDVLIVTPERRVLLQPMPEAPKSSPARNIGAITLDDALRRTPDVWVAGYATRASDARDELGRGAPAVAIMGPLGVADVVALARAGVALPAKTTCFNPKVAVGLVGTLLER